MWTGKSVSALERSRAPGISEAALREERKWTTCNPMRRKLVSHPRDWPWSSWSHYEKGGRVDSHHTLGEEDKPGSLPKRKIQKPHPGKAKGAPPYLTSGPRSWRAMSNLCATRRTRAEFARIFQSTRLHFTAGDARLRSRARLGLDRS